MNDDRDRLFLTDGSRDTTNSSVCFSQSKDKNTITEKFCQFTPCRKYLWVIMGLIQFSMLLFNFIQDTEEAYPNWPYVENIWKNVDRIVEDLINDEQPPGEKEGSPPVIPNPLVDDLSRFSLNSLTEDDSYIHNLPPYSFIEKPLQLSDKEEWLDLRDQYSFLNGNNEASMTEKNPGQIEFDPLDQPETQAYDKNPAILIAKRNITTAQDILNYLGSLMETVGKEGPVGDERDTTTRSFSKSGPWPPDVEEGTEPRANQSTRVNSLFLTAEDIMQAAQEW